MNHIKIFSVFLFLTYFNSYGQFFESIQYVNVEKYQGRNFTLESKIFYQNEITNESWVVLSARSVSAESKQIKSTLYNDNAGTYYKKGDWSSYELTGKIEKNAKYLGVGFSVAGTGSYYLDDFKLFVKDGKKR